MWGRQGVLMGCIELEMSLFGGLFCCLDGQCVVHKDRQCVGGKSDKGGSAQPKQQCIECIANVVSGTCGPQCLGAHSGTFVAVLTLLSFF